jgi:hypothetical protein
MAGRLGPRHDRVRLTIEELHSFYVIERDFWRDASQDCGTGAPTRCPPRPRRVIRAGSAMARPARAAGMAALVVMTSPLVNGLALATAVGTAVGLASGPAAGATAAALTVVTGALAVLGHEYLGPRAPAPFAPRRRRWSRPHR